MKKEIKNLQNIRVTGIEPVDIEPLKEAIRQNKTLARVMYKFKKQQEKGFKKYGTLVDPFSLEYRQWLLHLQEELIDAVVYIECVLERIEQVEKLLKGEDKK